MPSKLSLEESCWSRAAGPGVQCLMGAVRVAGMTNPGISSTSGRGTPIGSTSHIPLEEVETGLRWVAVGGWWLEVGD